MSKEYSANESLLQSYRGIFISSESFLLAVGAIVAGERLWFPSVVLGVIAVGMIWFMWFPVVCARLRIVDFYDFKLEEFKAEGQDNYESKEEAYVKNRKIRAAVNAQASKMKRTNWRPTRIKIDFVLPCIFTVIWGLITCLSFTSGTPSAKSTPSSASRSASSYNAGGWHTQVCFCACSFRCE